jgi:hypothetical protein
VEAPGGRINKPKGKCLKNESNNKDVRQKKEPLMSALQPCMKVRERAF